MNNYHTHTYLCQHAEGTAAQYAGEALKRNMEILGMSDHAPLPDNRWPHVRMAMSELDSYEEQIRTAREMFPDLTVLKGLECEWDRDYYNFYHDEILGRRAFDYLIGAVHFFRYDGQWHDLRQIRTSEHLRAYTDLLIATMNSGLFSFIAHPDAFGIGYDRWDAETEACSRDIIQAAVDLNIPIEINGYGFRKSPMQSSLGLRRKYPLPEFWRLAAEYPVRVICNSDAHRPQDVSASIDSARELAGEYNLQVLDALPLATTVGRRS